MAMQGQSEAGRRESAFSQGRPANAAMPCMSIVISLTIRQPGSIRQLEYQGGLCSAPCVPCSCQQIRGCAVSSICGLLDDRSASAG